MVVRTCCAAGHLPHDGRPGECTRALLALVERVDSRSRTERAERTRDERAAA